VESTETANIDLFFHKAHSTTGDAPPNLTLEDRGILGIFVGVPLAHVLGLKHPGFEPGTGITVGQITGQVAQPDFLVLRELGLIIIRAVPRIF